MATPVIATRSFVGERPNGERFEVTVRIGTPYQVNDVSWACPVGVDGIDKRLPDIHGIDSWQALLLCISLVRSRLGHFIESGGKLYWPDESSLEVSLSEFFGNDT